eukprot:gene27467-36128_t
MRNTFIDEVIVRSKVQYVPNDGSLTTFLNPFSYVRLRKTGLIRHFNYVHVDGVLLTWAFRLFGIGRMRLSFDMSSAAPQVLQHIKASDQTVFFIGSTSKSIDGFIEVIAAHHSDLRIVGFSAGHFIDEKHRLSAIEAIVAAGADNVICGMGTPVQESFLVNLLERGWSGTGYTCGGFIHQTAHKGIRYYPKIVDRLNIRWCYRIWDEPKLFTRYFGAYPIATSIILWDLIRWKLSTAATVLIAALTRAIKLPQSLSSALDTSRFWHLSPSSAEIRSISEAGFSSVRIPIKVLPHWNSETSSLSPVFLKRLADVVEECVSNHLYIVIDVHDFELSTLSGDHRAKLAVILSILRQLTAYFKGRFVEELAIELLNEPHGDISSVEWVDFLKEAYVELRTMDEKRLFVLSGRYWSSLRGLSDLKSAAFAGAARTFHYYSPMSFTHQGAEWTTQGAPAGSQGWGGHFLDVGSVRSDLLFAGTLFRPSVDSVVLGEFGVHSSAPKSDRLSWIREVRTQAERAGFDWYYWSLVGPFGIYSRERKCWNVEVLEALGLRTVDLSKVEESTCRRPKGLRELLTSVNTLTVPKGPNGPISVFIVVGDNDPSSGEAQRVVVDFSGVSRFKVKYLQVAQRGIPNTRNALLAEARLGAATHVAFVDDDEIVGESWLDALYKTSVDGDFQIVGGAVRPLFPNDSLSGSHLERFFQTIPRQTGTVKLIDSTANVLISIDCLRLLSGIEFREELALTGGSDKELFFRLQRAGVRFGWCEEALVFEEVPQSRGTESWLLQRAYRVGNSDFVCLQLNCGVLRISAEVIIALAALFFASLISIASRSEATSFHAKRRIQRQLGKFSALFGNRFQEYLVVHG